MILAVCREYSQPPGWFYGLDAHTQRVVLADWRIRNDTGKKSGSTRSGKEFWLNG